MTLIIDSGFTQWDPSLISTALWLDAADSSTITQSSGLVSQWNDKSGNGRNATASTTARPTYSATSFNSKPGLTFDGVANVLRADGLAAIAQGNDTPWSVVLAGNLSSNATFRTALAFGASSGSEYFHNLGTDASNLLITSRRGDTAVGQQNLTGSGGTSANRIFGLAFSGTTGFLFQNGTQDATGSLDVSSMASNINQFSIGALARQTTGSFLGCVIPEIIVTTGAISTTNRQKLEGYLAHKWGLTANLPSDHPYRWTPPTPGS